MKSFITVLARFLNQTNRYSNTYLLFKRKPERCSNTYFLYKGKPARWCCNKVFSCCRVLYFSTEYSGVQLYCSSSQSGLARAFSVSGLFFLGVLYALMDCLRYFEYWPIKLVSFFAATRVGLFLENILVQNFLGK